MRAGSNASKNVFRMCKTPWSADAKSGCDSHLAMRRRPKAHSRKFGSEVFEECAASGGAGTAEGLVSGGSSAAQDAAPSLLGKDRKEF